MSAYSRAHVRGALPLPLERGLPGPQCYRRPLPFFHIGVPHRFKTGPAFLDRGLW